MVRLALAAIAAIVAWLAFTAGGARLLARRLTDVAGVPVGVRRLGLEIGPPTLVLHDVRAGGVRAASARIPVRGALGLWRRPAAVRDVVLRGVRVVVPGDPPATVRVRLVELDRLEVDGPTTRFAARLAARGGRAVVRGGWRARRVGVAALFRGVDARSVAPLVTEASLRGGRLDGRLHVRGTAVRGDLRARRLAVRRGPVRARAARAVVDGLALDRAAGPPIARRAAVAGATLRYGGFAPVRRVSAVAHGGGDDPGLRFVARAALGGGRLRARGRVDASGSALDGAVKAEAVPLAPLFAVPTVGVAGGRLSGRLRVAGPPWAATDVALALDDVRLVESGAAGAEPLLACDRAVARAERIEAKPLRVRLRRASLDGLALHLRRGPDGLSPASGLATLAAWPWVLLATPADGSGPSDLPGVDVSWTAGKVVFEDHTTEPPGRLAIDDVAGELRQQAGPPPRHLAGALAGRLYAASIAAGLATEGARGHVALHVDGLDASLFDPWLGPALDLTARGTLSVHSEIDWDGRQFAAPSRVAAEALAVEDRGGRRLFGLSLARAVALAGDDGGGLTVTLPVAGAVDAAGAALATALELALAPAVTGPVAGVAAGRPVVVPFASGSDALDDAGVAVVDRLTALLHQQAALAVTVRGRAAREDAAADARALARARAERVRERLCGAGDVPAARVRIRAPAGDGSPAALVEAAS
jgi:hypothetical protein